MKKTFLLIAALFIMGSTFAGGGLFYLGPKIGYQTAKLSYNQADIKASFANHFTVGVFVSHRSVERILRVGYGNTHDKCDNNCECFFHFSLP